MACALRRPTFWVLFRYVPRRQRCSHSWIGPRPVFTGRRVQTRCADAAIYPHIWDTVWPFHSALRAPLNAHSLHRCLRPAAIRIHHSWHLKRAARRLVAAAASHCIKPIKFAPAWLSGCTRGAMHCSTWSAVKLHGSWVPAAKACVASSVARPSMQPPEPHSSSGLTLRHCRGWHAQRPERQQRACAILARREQGAAVSAVAMGERTTSAGASVTLGHVKLACAAAALMTHSAIHFKSCAPPTLLRWPIAATRLCLPPLTRTDTTCCAAGACCWPLHRCVRGNQAADVRAA